LERQSGPALTAPAAPLCQAPWRGRDHTPEDADRGLPINTPRLDIARAMPLNNKHRFLISPQLGINLSYSARPICGSPSGMFGARLPA
jgi:hypothetical protein